MRDVSASVDMTEGQSREKFAGNIFTNLLARDFKWNGLGKLPETYRAISPFGASGVRVMPISGTRQMPSTPNAQLPLSQWNHSDLKC